jgi:hypothetical protein
MLSRRILVDALTVIRVRRNSSGNGRAVGEIDRRWGGVNVLVHSALIPYAITSFTELTWEQLAGKLDRELAAVPCFSEIAHGTTRPRNDGAFGSLLQPEIVPPTRFAIMELQVHRKVVPDASVEHVRHT